MTTLQFQPAAAGGWVAIATGARTLLVGSEPDAGFVTSAAAALAETAGLQLALDLLTARGISATPPFALLEFHNGSGALRVILRGDVAVSVESPTGSESLSGSGVSTWTERDIDGATGVFVAVAGAAEVDGIGPLPLVSGSAYVAGLELQRAEAPAASPVPAPAPEPIAVPEPASPEPAAPVLVAVPDPVAPEPAAPEPIVEPEPEPEPEPVPVPVPVPAARPVISPPPPAPAPTPPTPATPEPASADFTEITQVAGEDGGDPAEHEHEPEHEPAREPEPAAVVERESAVDDENAERAAESEADAAPGESAEPASVIVVDPEDKTVVMPSRRKRPALSGDHDGQTVLTSDIAELRSRRAKSTQPPPPPAPTVALVLASGARELLTQPILVGRAPSVSQVSGGQMPRLLTVGGTDQDISRTHVRFALEGGTVVVTDLHSRNGTTIAMPGKDPQQLRAGEPTSVITGTIIDLGSGVTFTVDEA